jgi:hypothetical protein
LLAVVGVLAAKKNTMINRIKDLLLGKKDTSSIFSDMPPEQTRSKSRRAAFIDKNIGLLKEQMANAKFEENALSLPDLVFADYCLNFVRCSLFEANKSAWNVAATIDNIVLRKLINQLPENFDLHSKKWELARDKMNKDRLIALLAPSTLDGTFASEYLRDRANKSAKREADRVRETARQEAERVKRAEMIEHDRDILERINRAREIIRQTNPPGNYAEICRIEAAQRAIYILKNELKIPTSASWEEQVRTG